MSPPPAVEAVGLQRHYRTAGGHVKAVDGIDLRIDAGEFVAVVGRSGSGKTTLLDLLGLLLEPTAGTLRLEGRDTRQLDDGQRAGLRGERIGFVFQDFNLLPSLTALENVMLPVRYLRRRPLPTRAEAGDLLDQVGLADRADHRPGQLSGGQAQRVAIARALINRPALVLGDEPTGEVDTETAGELMDLLRRLNRERATTFVIVTHDPEVAGRTDRVIRLRDGRIESDRRAAAVSSNG